MSRLFLQVAIIFGIIFLLIEVALSNSLVATNNELDLPACYIQTEDGKVSDLGSLCQPPNNNINSTTQAANIKRLLDTKECPGCNLSGANLANARLSFVNFLNANLSGANLSGASLVGADLSNANLTNANLNNAKLNGARMVGTNLAGTNLTNANLLGVNLWNTDIHTAKLNSTKMPDGTLSH